MKNYYVNGWTEQEEKKLADFMLSRQKEGKGVHESFYEISTELGRSERACMNRWYAIRHKFLKEIV